MSQGSACPKFWKVLGGAGAGAWSKVHVQCLAGVEAVDPAQAHADAAIEAIPASVAHLSVLFSIMKQTLHVPPTQDLKANQMTCSKRQWADSQPGSHLAVPFLLQVVPHCLGDGAHVVTACS